MTKGSKSDGVVFHAGFPNAGEDHRFGSLSLDDLVVKHRSSTFFWRLEDGVEVMAWPVGSIVVVDRSLVPKQGSVVVLVLEGDFLLGKYHQNKLWTLQGEAIESEVAQVWGVVTHVLQEVG